MYHLNDREIEAKKADIDKTVLNNALDLVFSFGFKKDRICSMQIKDAFDGTDLLPEIIVDPNKSRSISTTGDIGAILEPYISYLSEKYSVDPQKPLFPEYYDDRGKKNLQRHTEKYSLYRDLHKLSAESIRYYHDMFAKQGMDAQSIVKAVKDRLGKGERTIKDTLKKSKPTSIAARSASIPTRQEISEWSAKRALEQREREEAAKDVNLSDNYMPEQPISLEGKLPRSDDVRDKSIMPESQDLPQDYGSGGYNHLLGVLPQAVSEYFNKIHSEGISTPKYSFGYSPSGDKYLHSLSYVEYDPRRDDRKQEKDLYFEKQEYERKAENESQYLQVLKNLVDIIRHTGMFSNELVRLTVGDVIKPNYVDKIRNHAIEPQWIVDKIAPVKALYKKEYSALPIIVTDEGQFALLKHIQYLKEKKRTFVKETFLFTELMKQKRSHLPRNIDRNAPPALFYSDDFPDRDSIASLLGFISDDLLKVKMMTRRGEAILFRKLYTFVNEGQIKGLNKILQFPNFYEYLIARGKNVVLNNMMIWLLSKTRLYRKEKFYEENVSSIISHEILAQDTFDIQYLPMQPTADADTVQRSWVSNGGQIIELNRLLLEKLYPDIVPKQKMSDDRRERLFIEQREKRFWEDLKKYRLTNNKCYEDLREDGICEYCWNLHKEALPEDIIVRQVMRHGRHSETSKAKEILKKVRARE